MAGARFGSETYYEWSADPTSKLFAGDFNGDGNADIGVWGAALGSWVIRYGNGAGQFSGQTWYTWSADTTSIPFAGDFNGDGYADIGVWGANTDSWVIRYGDGAGQFGRESYYTWDAHDDATPFAGDFNADGYADIGVWDPDGVWRIRYGDGSGQFSNETTYTWSEPASNRKIFTGDFNGDSFADIGIWQTDTGTWYLRFHPNAAPITDDGTLSTSVGRSAPIDLTTLAYDPDGLALTFGVQRRPQHGTVTLNSATGIATYTPETDYIGTDSFSYSATDEAGIKNHWNH